MRYEQKVFNHRNQQQLAEYRGISTRTLERWRSIGWGPAWKPITAIIQEGLLVFEIPTEFQCNSGDLEYCLAGGLPCRIAPGDAVEPSDRVRTPRVYIGRLP